MTWNTTRFAGRAKRHFGPILVALVIGSYSLPAAAYIDPGTGSALLYVVTGLVVSGYFGARGLYYRLVELAFSARYKHQTCNLAIHCEDPRYEITFLPVIRALVRRNIELTFFTMYERTGAGFAELPAGVTHQSIAPGMVGYAYLNNLQAKMLVTTTPQLDVMTFRRSKRVKHYSYIQHALGESLYVRPYAFDFYDSILCCGPTLVRNIRRIEFIRKLPAKDLYETGIPHYDELLKAVPAEGKTSNDQKVVLVAPSWGPLSLFQRFGTGFVRKIATKYKVIVRPHPQMKVSQTELYNEILAIEGVTVNTATTPAEAMAAADVLVSDISGIMHEFAFIHGKPVVIVDHTIETGGLEGSLFNSESTLRERCKEFIVPVPPADIDNLTERVDAALQRTKSTEITTVRDELIYHFGHASDVAAEQIEDILRCL